jgi:hypothetical protein
LAQVLALVVQQRLLALAQVLALVAQQRLLALAQVLALVGLQQALLALEPAVLQLQALAALAWKQGFQTLPKKLPSLDHPRTPIPPSHTSWRCSAVLLPHLDSAAPLPAPSRSCPCAR